VEKGKVFSQRLPFVLRQIMIWKSGEKEAGPTAEPYIAKKEEWREALI